MVNDVIVGQHRVSFHLISLTVFLLYLNFVPQRIELVLTDKLDQFPFPYAWLLLSFLYCLFERLVVKRECVFDRRMKLFVSVVFLLVMIQLLSLIHSNCDASQNKKVWFEVLSMVYLYFPMLTALYVYVAVDDMGKFRLMVKVFFIIICGQMIIGAAGLFFPSYIAQIMGWRGTEHDYIRSSSSIIGGHGPMAFLFLISIPLLFSYFVNRGGPFVPILPALCISLLLTYSRGPILLAVCCMVVMFVIVAFRYKSIYRYGRIIIGCILLSLVVIGILEINTSYLFRANVKQADMARLKTAGTALSLMTARPLLGHGPGNLYIRKYEKIKKKHIVIFGYYSLKTPHNLYLLFVAENGLIFTALWMIFILVQIKLVMIKREDVMSYRIISLGFICSIVMVYFFSVISDTLVLQYRVTPTFWFLVGLGMAFARLVSDTETEQYNGIPALGVTK